MTASDRWQDLEPRRCPVCGGGPQDSALFLAQSLDPSRLNAYSYASRKTPEFMRFELVTCRRCETVYASSAPPKGALARAYHEWDRGRREFHQQKARGEVRPDGWQRDYFQGRDAVGRQAETDHMIKVKPPRVAFPSRDEKK